MNSSYIIAIPSYKRSMILLYRTLNFLERNSIDPKLIHIFIVEEDQEDYNQIPTYLYNKIIVGVKGIVRQREFIDNYFDEGVNIVSIDDDIQDIIFANPHEEIPLDEFLNNAFELCKKEGAYIWGIYPVGNPFYAQKNRWYSTHLTYICGALYGYINRPKNEDIKCVLTYNGQNGEDFERSIKYWLHDKKVIRFNAVKHAILAKMVEVSGIYRAGWNQWSFIVNYYTRIILLILVYILRKMGCITSDYGTEAKKPYA